MNVVCQDGNIYYSNPQSPDSDGDGLLDGQEITYKADKAVHYNYGLKQDETTYYSVSFTMYSNPMEADTDGDGIIDNEDSMVLQYGLYRKLDAEYKDELSLKLINKLG